MREHLRPAPFPATTQAAEGLPRRRWSVAEIEAMVAKGIIAEDERFELIGGEVVPMSPKGARHELVKTALNRFFQRVRPIISRSRRKRRCASTRTVSWSPTSVLRRGLDLKALDGAAVLLAVEIADTSLAYDRGRKIEIYAGLWRARGLGRQCQHPLTRVHRELAQRHYGRTPDEPYGRPAGANACA